MTGRGIFRLFTRASMTTGMENISPAIPDSIAPVNPLEQILSARLKPPIWNERGVSPFYLGTDRLGRDVLSNIIFGLRVSLLVGFIAVGISMVIGLTLGLTAGYSRGFWENFIMRAVDVQLSLPLIMVALW